MTKPERLKQPDGPGWWWYYSPTGEPERMMVYSGVSPWFAQNFAEQYFACDTLSGTWLRDTSEPPQEKPEVELPELPTLRYARDKITGKIISVVTWAKGEELSHSTHNGATPVSCSDPEFQRRYTWLTEDEVKELTQ